MVYQLSSVPLPLPSVPLPLLSFLNVLNLRHSVHWGITPPPFKNTTPFFLIKPHLNQQTVQGPIFRQPSPSTLVFRDSPPPP